jgi:Mn-dependent DtxR family transcriptional regulator
MEEFPIFDESEVDQATIEKLREELADAEAELIAHMASWEYAYAMGSTLNNDSKYPLHVATRDRTKTLNMRVLSLRTQLSEFEI